MKTWSIPAKTFLLGEYAVLKEGPALILTTTPCFQVSLTEEPGLQGIHPESPAGRYWADMGREDGLSFNDPFQGIGGMGASSAQFIGAYLATHETTFSPDRGALLDAYFKYAWNGEGLKPSGYDVLAQSSLGCVYINKANKILETYLWPFPDLDFILIHTGQKLATHNHLQTVSLPSDMTDLSQIVEHGREALKTANSEHIIKAVNHYAHALQAYDLVAEHTKKLLNELSVQPEILAAKGCGALGSDVIFLLVAKDARDCVYNYLIAKGIRILATADNFYR